MLDRFNNNKIKCKIKYIPCHGATKDFVVRLRGKGPTVIKHLNNNVSFPSVQKLQFHLKKKIVKMIIGKKNPQQCFGH